MLLHTRRSPRVGGIGRGGTVRFGGCSPTRSPSVILSTARRALPRLKADEPINWLGELRAG
jgi:hypothetical protein